MLSALKQVVVWVLTIEARLALIRHRPRIIAVTGSVGKTTTKDAIYAALSGRISVRASEKTFNSDIGVPLAVLALPNGWNNPLAWAVNIVWGLGVALFSRSYPEWLVLEVGADRPGDIRRIAQWLRPDIAVLTGVPEIPAHVEYFASPEDVLKEKRSLAEYLRPGGKLVLHGDDERAASLRGDFRGASITYGISSDLDFHASHEEIVYENEKPAGVRFRANHGASSIPVALFGALGRPRTLAALAAIAVADCVGVDGVTAAQGLNGWKPAPGRLRLIEGTRGSAIIDDTYNASPAAVFAALDALGELKTGGRKIAILGDMLELGRHTKEAHRQVGERAARAADMLMTVGFRSRASASAALDAGMPDANIRQYEIGESERAGAELVRELQPGDVVLVKGSQGIRMEKAVKILMAHPEEAERLLVRMDAEWEKR
jgi:UDP-N-acetylmuramoyl-tripeptide--D-alanyl-D-alanine ligase